MRKILAVLMIMTMTIGSMNAQNNKPEPLVVVHTKFGDITMMLYNDTPKHRDNFLKLVKEGWYQDSPFHRIIKGFMIQGGQNKDGRLDPGYKIDAEINPTKHFHKKGALAAARLGDQINPMKKSSGSQFYIVQGIVLTESQLLQYGQQNGIEFTPEQIEAYTTVGGTPHLDGGYTVFGEVVDGMDVIDKIAAVKTARGDRPIEEVVMSIEILE